MSAAFAVSIEEAAKMVGISRTGFYSEYIDKGRIKPIPFGTRRIIDVKELEGAYQQYVADTRRAA